MRARQVKVDLTVLFADLRGYTSLSQTLAPDAISSLLDAFYDECAEAIWEYDGILNKTIGDAVMAVFNFPIRHQNHAERAVLAGREIQRRCEARRAGLLGEGIGLTGSELGVGVGIDTGLTSFGEFGRSHRDLTAIGTVVNTASRAQAAADVGEILITQAVYDRAGPAISESRGRDYRLKGFEDPVHLYSAGSPQTTRASQGPEGSA